jgi:CRP-like cAMP-binding protein
MLDHATDEELTRLGALLRSEPVDAGTVVMEQGDPGSTFALLLDGELEVVHIGRERDHPIGVVGAGSVLGELALLSGRPRAARVTARTPGKLLLGDVQAWQCLLTIPGVVDRMAELVARRTAENARPVPVTLPDGRVLALRCLLPSDREGFVEGIHRLSRESLRRRFFSGGEPNSHVIDYLLSMNFMDHFAWLAFDPAVPGGQGVAVARFIRDREHPYRAEVAFSVVDDFQGHGIGTMLLGALACAAELARIDAFVAQVLEENERMRRVFAKAGATFVFDEPGVVRTEFPTAAASVLLDRETRAAVTGLANDVITAHGLALARHADPT